MTHFLSVTPESTSAFVRDSNGRMRAVVSMVKYSPTQAYCTVAEVDENLKGKYIGVEETDNPYCLKITNVKDTADDMRLLPIYVQAHHNPKNRLPLEHLIDRLSESILGQVNLELKKNVTVDLLEDENLGVWRDKAAFFVTDRQRLCEIVLGVSDLLRQLHPSKDVKISQLDESHMEKISEYDQSVCGVSRSSFLEHLFKQSTVLIAEREDDSVMEGYLVAKGNRVLALYADSEEIARSLLERYLRSTKIAKVIMCTRQNCWQTVRSPNTPTRRICRRHTRSVPTNVKWDRVYAFNVGMHIV